MNSLAPLLKSISSNETTLDIEVATTRLIEFAVNSGMAPFMLHCSNSNRLNNESKYNSILNSASLTAKIIIHTQLQAIDDLLLQATPKISKIILLKGAALCQIYYPQPHFRIMSDIDLLVSNEDAETLTTILSALGYIQESKNPEEYYETHHHRMPFYNKSNNVWIEVHTHLFSGSNPALNNKIFKIDNIFKNTINMTNEKYTNKVAQLCPELQLIYICSHWADELKKHKACIQITDMILIIKNSDNPLDWKKTLTWINNTNSASHLYLILSYLCRNKIITIPDNFLKEISLQNKNMGYLNMLILHKIINKFMLGGSYNDKLFTESNIGIIWDTLLQPSSSFTNLLQTPWNILFPPSNTKKYNIFSLLNRIKNLIT